MPSLPASVTALPRAATVARLRDQVSALESRSDDPIYPVSAVLTPLLPYGGLKAGSAYCLTSPALVAPLLAEASRAGLWCGLVGLPDFGAEAAKLAGVTLDRLALVPNPGSQWLTAVATLSSALPIVGVKPPLAVSPADAAKLAARLRDHASVLLVVGSWPGSQATLSLNEPGWSGLGEGWGRLTSRAVSLTVASKIYPRAKSRQVLLPGPDGCLTAAPLASSADRVVDELARRPPLRMAA